MIFIANFNNSRNLQDIKYLYDKYKGTNLDFLLQDSEIGRANWSVPRGASIGDIVIFMCAKTARDNLGLATSHIPEYYGEDFREFVDKQKVLYKKYSGNLLGCGIVSSNPNYVEPEKWWMADIEHLCLFETPIYIDEFRSFISISKTNSFTYLKDDQWERLKWVVNQFNPEFFQNVIPPDAEVLHVEFEEALKKESKKSLNQLKKEAKKKESKPTVSTVQTKTYHRDSTIAAYVKKRAKGFCQLCGIQAPFNDKEGDPYLECHHIVWLSEGGEGFYR